MVPFVKTEQRLFWPGTPYRSFYKEQHGVHHGDHRTPYSYELIWRHGKTNRFHPWGPGNPPPKDVGNFPTPPAASQSVINSAYAELLEKALGTGSQLGAFAAEWRRSFGMIADSAYTMRESWRAFRKGKLFKTLSKGDSWDNTAAKKWLEYWFGWAPAVGDIYGSIQAIERPLPYADYLGSAREYWDRNWTQNSENWEGTGYALCKQGAFFRLANPNLFLANQLGLVNPASVAWEITPLSFLIDWVADVGDWINSFSDFIGVSIERPYTTVFRKGFYFGSNTTYPDKWISTETVDMVRSPSLERPMPNLNFSANLGNSVTRAASAVSLLHLALNKRRHNQ